MARMFTSAKDPDDALDYLVDWNAWLDGDTIASSTFSLILPSGLVIDRQSWTATSSVVWLSGGIIGNSQILCRITTTAGRTKDQTVVLRIRPN